MTRALIAALVCGLTTLTGCSTPLIQTPDKFLRLEHQEHEYAYRATSADGVVLAGRVFDYDKDLGGGLAFWVDAIKLRLSAVGGYALLKEQDIKAKSGLAGKQLRFGHDEKRGTYQYWVTLFVAGDRLVVLEAGGHEAKLSLHERAISSALASVNP